ncbi:MAG TPA: RloB family protein [Accumulibacter sp.]|nr:RloB family protein [Rhodocyclaceae bacterium]HNC53730.1 RloB family protein [Accumulibacter sp.]
MARRMPISPLRDRESLLRKPGRRPPRSITLIVCEGETEQEYFEAARIRYGLTTAQIVLAENTKGAAPISVVACAEVKCADHGGYDRVYCVFDRNGHESFDRARARIKTLAGRRNKPLPIREAISIPCFEFWVLLHHERTDAPFQRCADVIERLRERMPGYEKAHAVIARQLMSSLEQALDNAAWVETRVEHTERNPYTSVHHVLRHFAQVADQKDIA